MNIFLFFVHYTSIKDYNNYGNAFFALSGDSYDESMKEKVFKIMNMLLAHNFNREKCTSVELVTEGLIQKINNPSNLGIAKPYIMGLKQFVYFDDSQHTWVIQNSMAPDFTILNLLKNNKKLNILLDIKIKDIYTVNNIKKHLFRLLHIQNMEMNYCSIETLDLDMLKAISKKNDIEYAVILHSDVNIEEMESICYATEDNNSFHIYQKSEKYLYEVKSKSGEIIYRRVISL